MYDEVEFGAGCINCSPDLSFAGECGHPKLNLPIVPFIGFNQGALVAPCSLVPVVGPVKHGLFMSAVTYA